MRIQMKSQSIKLPMIIIGITLIASLSFGVTVFNQKYYLPNLPFDSLSKKQVYEAVQDSSTSLTFLSSADGYNWYIYQGNPKDGGHELITRMKKKGIEFKEQLGSGYFFTSALTKESIIVESEMWTSKYIIYQVPHGLIL